MSKKIFIVTDGCYSDYSIHAVFENENDAEAYKARYNLDFVEEHDLYGSIQDRVRRRIKDGEKLYEIWFKCNGGSWDASADTAEYDHEDYETKENDKAVETGCDMYGNGWAGTYVVARSEEHAIKTGRERLVVHLALRQQLGMAIEGEGLRDKMEGVA